MPSSNEMTTKVILAILIAITLSVGGFMFGHALDNNIHENPEAKSNRSKVITNEAVTVALREVRSELLMIRQRLDTLVKERG